MDTRRLEVFCKVVELRSFSRAAEAVLLSQPTVSEHVRILEETFGGRLLDRLGREVLPTHAGEILYRYAKRMLQLQEEAKQAIEEFRGNLSGNLLLGASTIPGAYILPRLVQTFKTANPAIRITLKIAGSAQIVSGLMEEHLEFALIGAIPREQALESRPFFSDELVLVVPPGHPWAGREHVAPEELLGEPILLREPGSGTRQITTDALRSSGVDPSRLNAVAEMGSTEAVRQGVKAGLGVAILSSMAVREDLERAELVSIPLKNLSVRRSFHLAVRKHRELSPVAQAFLKQLESWIPSITAAAPPISA